MSRVRSPLRIAYWTGVWFAREESITPGAFQTIFLVSTDQVALKQKKSINDLVSIKKYERQPASENLVIVQFNNPTRPGIEPRPSRSLAALATNEPDLILIY